MKTKMKVVLGVSAVAVTGILLGGVLGSQVSTDISAHASQDQQDERHNAARAEGGKSSQALTYAVDHLLARQASIDAVWVDRNLGEVLPNQTFSVDGSDPQTASAGIVHGRVVEVREGASYRSGIDGGPSTELPFDAPDALWRAMVLTIAVQDDFDPSREAEDMVSVGVAFDGEVDAATMLAAYQEQHVLVVLDRLGFFPFDQTLYMPARSGALLGLVAEDGSISMPLLGEEESSYLEGLYTLDHLSAESEVAKPVISLSFDGGYNRE